MPQISQLLQDSWNWFALDVTIKATVVLLLAAGLIPATGSASAAWRHRIWSLAFIGILLLPLLQLVTPGLLRPIVPQPWQPVSARTSHSGPATTVAYRELSASVAPGQGLLAPEPDRQINSSATTERSPMRLTEGEPRFNKSGERRGVAAVARFWSLATHQSVNWLLVVWCTGFVITLTPLITGLIHNVQLKRRCYPMTEAVIGRRIATLGKRVGLVRLPTVLLGNDQQMPMTFGFRRPCVVLPAAALQWSRDRFDSVVLHELAHIKRFDVAFQLVARVACGMYWFHPLAWWAIGKMRLARELACDDCVLSSGQEPSDYAAELLDIAREYQIQAPYVCAALSMARRSQLEGRLLAVLDTNRRRTPLGSLRAVMLSVLTVGVVVGIGSVRPVLEANGVEQIADSPSSATVSEGKRCLVRGVVLTPDNKPAVGARIEVIAHDNIGRWDRHSRDESRIDRFEARVDAAGRFLIELPRNISRPRRRVVLMASASGTFPAVENVDTRRTHVDVRLQLYATKEVRIQLVDPVGNPISDVVAHVQYLLLDGDEYVSNPHPDGNAVTKVWPTFSRSNEDGYAAANLPVTTKRMSLVVNDEHVGSHLVRVEVADEAVSAVLDSPTFLNGKVIDPDGAPVTGAELIMMQQPYRVVRTDADGAFRAARGSKLSNRPGGQSIIHVYPPSGTDLLFQAIEWEWPNDGIGDAELKIELERGIMIEGRVVESGSGKPVEGARIVFEPQVENNPHFKKSYRGRSSGADMRYTTDADGRFRMPVIAGPGYLQVNARSLDYLPVETSMGNMWYGKPGLQRQYYDGVERLELESGSSPDPITIELTRGKTLHREVVRPDGSPAQAKAYAASYLQVKEDVNSWLPEIPITDGQLDVPGFHPKRSTPLFILDIEAECGAVISPALGHVDPNEATIKLLPCGAAKFRFVSDKGKPLADYQPQIHLIFKEGAPATHHIQPDQPLWSDTIIWDNVVRPKKLPKTDAGGRVVVDGLIPDADYNLYFVNKEGRWDEGYQFTIHTGETTDVGEVVLHVRD